MRKCFHLMTSSWLAQVMACSWKYKASIWTSVYLASEESCGAYLKVCCRKVSFDIIAISPRNQWVNMFQTDDGSTLNFSQCQCIVSTMGDLKHMATWRKSKVGFFAELNNNVNPYVYIVILTTNNWQVDNKKLPLYSEFITHTDDLYLMWSVVMKFRKLRMSESLICYIMSTIY